MVFIDIRAILPFFCHVAIFFMMAGWSAVKGQQILGIGVRNHEVYGSDNCRNHKPHIGIPDPRDAVTPLFPACVRNHPVA